MTGKIILSVGMPRAGSGWYYNLTHDLLVAVGFQDAHQIRERFHLGGVLTEVNLNIGALTLRRVLMVLLPTALGNTFAIKTHAGPSSPALFLIQKGLIKPTYIYRDPRDALLSAYEYGQRARANHRDNAFARLETLEQAVDFMQAYVRASEAWLACDRALHVRYEDFLKDYDSEVFRLTAFLGLPGDTAEVLKVSDQYRPERGSPDQKGWHLSKGKIGRFREVFNDSQKDLFNEVFGPYLEKMGYSV
jgi:hypothetical protein